MAVVLNGFKLGLLLLGIAAELLALFSAIIAGWWLLLKFADWRGNWMDTHPETDAERKERKRK